MNQLTKDQAATPAPAAHSITRSRRWMIGSLLTVAAGAAVTFGLAPSARGDKDTEALKGKAAPEITLETLGGPAVKLSDQKGKVVLIDFWATWCAPCVKSLPHINDIAAKKAWQEKGLAVWAVNVRDQPDKVKKFVEDKKLALTVPLDVQGKVATAYDIDGLPTTVVIGRDGNVAEVFIGIGPDSDKLLEDAVEKALGTK